MILELVGALHKPAQGPTFAIDTQDFYASDDGRSCGATVVYKHAWNEANFKLDVSLREAPSLELADLALQPQPYHKHLEFKPFPVRSFQFAELLGENFHAASQRVRSRDLYDLMKAADKPLNTEHRVREVIRLKNACRLSNRRPHPASSGR